MAVTTGSGDTATVRPGAGPRDEAPVRPLALWSGVLAGPLAFFLHLQLGYVLVPWSCEAGGYRWLLHLVAVAALALTAAGTVLSWRTLERSGRDWPDEQVEGDPQARSRFLAGVGVASGAFFLLVMLAQWIPIWILDPCHRA